MSAPEHVSAIIERWMHRQAEWSRLHIQVDGGTLASEVLDDLNIITSSHGNTPLSLSQSARESGYSAGHLGREVKAGRIPNAGRDNAPKILRRDLPRKPGTLLSPPIGGTLSRKRIARAVANSTTRESADG